MMEKIIQLVIDYGIYELKNRREGKVNVGPVDWEQWKAKEKNKILNAGEASKGQKVLLKMMKNSSFFNSLRAPSLHTGKHLKTDTKWKRDVKDPSKMK